MSSYSTASSDDRSYNNGYEEQFGYNDSQIFDFVEDFNYIYYLRIVEIVFPGSGYSISMVKTPKSEMFDESPTITATSILGLNGYVNAPATRSNAHMLQDNTYIYLAVNDEANTQMLVKKIQKSDLSIVASTTEAWTSPGAGISSDTWSIMDVAQDDTYFYVCGRDTYTSGGTQTEGWIAVYDKATLTTVAVISGYASTVYGYYFSSISCVRNGLIQVTGVDSGDTGITTLSFNGTSFTVESRCSITGSPDDTKHMNIACDKQHDPFRSIVGLNESDMLRYRNSGGAQGDGGGTYEIEIDDVSNGADFIVRTIFNYGSASANSQPVFRIASAGGGANHPLDIYITNAGVLTINMYDGAANRTVATATLSSIPQPYETKSLNIIRRSGVVRVVVDNISLTVTPTAYIDTPIDYSDCYVTGGWGSQVDFCYESMYFNANGAIVLNFDFSSGVNLDGLEYKKASYYAFDLWTMFYVRRFSLLKGRITIPRYSSASGTLSIVTMDDSFDNIVYSSDISGDFTQVGDTASHAVWSEHDSRYYILTNMNYDSKYCFQISCIHLLIDAGGNLYFSFEPNAKLIYVKFAPTATGYFFDNIDIEDVDSSVSESFSCYGTCYEESETLTLDITDLIIRMNEGHKDYLRYSSSSLTNETISTYERIVGAYAGTKYAYNAVSATFTEDTDGLYKKVDLTISKQDLSNIFDAWFDTVNYYYDLSDGKLLKENPLAVYIVSGVTATRAEVQVALDSNYNFNTETEYVKFSEDEDTGLIENAVITAKKEVEVYAVRNLNVRDHYCIRFRVKCKTNGNFDDFRVYEMRYSPSGAFYVGGDDAEN